MKPHRRTRLLALPLLALVLPLLAGALHGQLGLEAAAVAEREGAAALVTGRVQRPDGTAASGAVVVSSLGGKAVTAPDGRFELALEVPPDAPAFHVTAVAALRGASHTATILVQSVATGAPIDAGTVVLAASAGCTPSWIPTFAGMPGVNGSINALTVFDDGGGPALYAGGEFTIAGGVAASSIAKWDGSSWSPLGSGMSGLVSFVSALTVFDDGGGPALYAGGWFTTAGGVAANSIAKWDGSSWSPLGSGISFSVSALTVFNDGGGPALYAGGNFTTAGGVAASSIAKWDGSRWSPLGSGMNNFVYALTVFDDGGGPALYAGGHFTTAGGTAASRIAKWDGTSWSPLGSGLSYYVRALAVFDDGGGPALYAGGGFTTAGGVAANRIAKWDGSSWSPVGGGMSAWVGALTVFDDGGGRALYAGGSFTTAGGVAANRIAKWDGSSWSPLGSGSGSGYASVVNALAVFDDGGGPALYAGGFFDTAGGTPASHIAQWDGSSWAPLGSGMSDWVRALAVFDDGGGPALYAGGEFTSAGGVAANRIAKWDGSSWSPLGSGISGGLFSFGIWVSALTVFDDGGGPALYAGGSFPTAGGVAASHIAKWDGSSWSPLGSGMNGYPLSFVNALAVFDDGGGPALYAGGAFTQAGGFSANRIAKWNGSSWSPLGGGMNSAVSALTVFDDGSGPALYAGGDFTSAGGVAASGIARWNGSSWSPLGSGMGGPSSIVSALTVFDDGGGPALYAGGWFTTAGGIGASHIAKWDGTSWSPLGSGVNSTVSALTVFDDGDGPALYAGGYFTTAGGVAASHIAKWDGSSWSPLGSGMNLAVWALTVFNDGGGPGLNAGGSFTSAIDSGDSFLAQWGCSSAFAPVPGCFGSPATLSALSESAKVGGTLSVQLDGGTFASGIAFLFAGLDGTDAAGCGLFVPGLGELLLGPAPTPLSVAHAITASGSAAFSVAIPSSPVLVGLTIAVQAAHVGAVPTTSIEMSTGLAVTFSG